MSYPSAGEPDIPENAPGGGPSPSQLARETAKSYARVRALRRFILIFGVALAAYLLRELWSRRPVPAPATGVASTSPPPSDTVQSLDRFKFSSAILGKKDYSISADRLRGTESGMRLLEGIRSLELVRPDGKSLKGSADRGSLAKEDESSEHGSGGRLALEGNVRIEGPGGELIETESIEYSRKAQTLSAPGPCRFAMGGSSGTAGSLVYDLEGKLIHVTGGIVVRYATRGEPDTILRAQTAVVSAGGESADFQGSVTLSRGDDVLSGPALHLDRQGGEDGASRFTIGPGAHGRLVPAEPSEAFHPLPSPSAPATGPGGAPPPGARPGAATSGKDGSRPVVLAADRIEGNQAGHAGPRILTLRGSASAREDPLPGGLQGREISADTILVEEKTAGAPRRFIADGGVFARMPAPPAVAGGPFLLRTLACGRLDIVTLADGSIDHGEADGDVRVRAEGGTARAARAAFLGGRRIELRGDRPRLDLGDRSLVADEVDILSNEGLLEARGDVRARYVPDIRGGSAMFAQGEPVDLASAMAILERPSRRGTFTGSVVARQGGRALSAAKLVLIEATGDAHAEGSVSVRSFRLEAQSEVPVRIDADSLDYERATGTARFKGHAVYREPGRMLAAAIIEAVGSAGAGGVLDATAEGGVRFEGEGKRGTSDAAHYLASDRTLVLEGKERPAEVIESATGRVWRGPSLTWAVAADSIPTVTGEQGRSRVTGALPSAVRESVGKKANRGAPR